MWSITLSTAQCSQSELHLMSNFSYSCIVNSLEKLSFKKHLRKVCISFPIKLTSQGKASKEMYYHSIDFIILLAIASEE